MALSFSKIAGKNLASPLKSGLVFWTGGIAAWIWHTGIASFYQWCLKLKPIEISLYSFVVLLAMAVSTILVQRSALPVLRFLEGYYFPERLRSLLLKKLESGIRRKKKRFNALYMRYESGEPMTRKELETFASIEIELSRIPDKAFRLPTRLGNILRFIEMRPKEKYGLDSFICFPRLWRLLPADVKGEFSKIGKTLMLPLISGCGVFCFGYGLFWQAGHFSSVCFSHVWHIYGC